MRTVVAILAMGAVLALPSAAAGLNPGSDDTSDCGAFHGMFGVPAHGFLRDYVPVNATSGLYRGGFVGEHQRNPACHVRGADG